MTTSNKSNKTSAEILNTIETFENLKITSKKNNINAFTSMISSKFSSNKEKPNIFNILNREIQPTKKLVRSRSRNVSLIDEEKSKNMTTQTIKNNKTNEKSHESDHSREKINDLENQNKLQLNKNEIEHKEVIIKKNYESPLLIPLINNNHIDSEGENSPNPTSPKKPEKIYYNKSSHNFFNKNITDLQTKINNKHLSMTFLKNKNFVEGKKKRFKSYLNRQNKLEENSILIKKVELDDKFRITNLHYKNPSVPNNDNLFNNNLTNNLGVDGSDSHSLFPNSNSNSVLLPIINKKQPDNSERSSLLINKMNKTNININKLKIEDRKFNKTLDPQFFLKNKSLPIKGVHKNYMNFKTNSHLFKSFNSKLIKSNNQVVINLDLENKMKMYGDEKDFNQFKKIVDDYHNKFNYSLKKIKILDSVDNTSNYDLDSLNVSLYNKNSFSVDKSKIQKTLKKYVNKSKFSSISDLKTLEEKIDEFKKNREKKKENVNYKIKEYEKKNRFHETNTKILKKQIIIKEMRLDKMKNGESNINYSNTKDEKRDIDSTMYKHGVNLKKNLNRGVAEILLKIVGREKFENSLKYIE